MRPARVVPLLALPLLFAVAANRPARVDGDAEATEAARRPIGYFNANCASCHGDYGSFWGDGFAAEYGADELREIVAEMAAGPGFAPIHGAALDVQTAYNRSLTAAAEGPFVVAYRDGDSLAGEVTPGSTVTLETDAAEVAATVEGHSWQATAAGVVAVRADNAGRTTRVELTGEIAWSHGK